MEMEHVQFWKIKMWQILSRTKQTDFRKEQVVTEQLPEQNI